MYHHYYYYSNAENYSKYNRLIEEKERNSRLDGEVGREQEGLSLNVVKNYTLAVITNASVTHGTVNSKRKLALGINLTKKKR